MRLVILESPYAGDVTRNVAYARACVRDSLLRGEAPIASHLLYTQPGILNDDMPEERKLGISAGLAWRKMARAAVVYTDLGISGGMRLAIVEHEGAAVPVEYRQLGEGWEAAGPARHDEAARRLAANIEAQVNENGGGVVVGFSESERGTLFIDGEFNVKAAAEAVLSAAPAQAEAPVALKVLQEALKPFAEASSRFDEAATHMGYAPSFDEYKPYTSFTHGDLRRARKAYEALASHPAPEPQAMGDAVLPRGGVEQDWWAESVKLYRRLRLIERAAQAVIDETAKIHDNEPWPVKYRAPYGAITELGKVLGDDTIEARKRSALDAASLASPLSSVPAPEPQAVPEGERAVAIRYRSTYDGHWQFWPIEEWNAEHGKGWRERYPNAEPLYPHPLPAASPKPGEEDAPHGFRAHLMDPPEG